MPYESERAFLHDLNNKLAIIDGRIHMLMRKLQKTPDLSHDEILKRAQDMRVTVLEIAQLTADRRAALYSDDAA